MTSKTSKERLGEMSAKVYDESVRHDKLVKAKGSDNSPALSLDFSCSPCTMLVTASPEHRHERIRNPLEPTQLLTRRQRLPRNPALDHLPRRRRHEHAFLPLCRSGQHTLVGHQQAMLVVLVQLVEDGDLQHLRGGQVALGDEALDVAVERGVVGAGA